MYEKFFQLTKAPFSLASDPNCVHLTPAIRDVMRNLVYGVRERRGCTALTAEPGLGKTTVLRLLDDLLVETDTQSSIISIPTVSSSEFLELLMLNFGIEDVPSSKARRLKALEEFLLRSDEAGRISALIVDEAHKLSDEVLEEIRLLSNFESGSRKLLQIVLAGQTELNDRLNRPGLWQFKQRIATRLTLNRLDPASVLGYIQFRWSEAADSPFPFNAAATAAIAASSGGIPRLINTICHNALLIAFSETCRTVTPALVHEACTRLDLPTLDLESPGPELERVPEVKPPSLPPQEQANWWLKLRRRGDAPSTSLARAKTSILSLDEPLE